MGLLFSLETDRVRLKWSDTRECAEPSPGGTSDLGTLHVRALRPGAATSLTVWRSRPSVATNHPDILAGPMLFEQRDYRLTAVATGGGAVNVTHRDPLILRRFEDEPERFDSLINFGSQVGTSSFRVVVDGVAELEVEIEVFPTKLDYKADYESMLADVQATLYGLAFEYLRATWRGATPAPAPSPTQVEWLVLLRGLVDELERALRRIATRPVRGLRRDPTPRRPDQVQRVDSGLRSALRRHAQRGSRGALTPILESLSLPHRLEERRALPTLDTPEHRWLATQVDRIRQRVAALITAERGRSRASDGPSSARQSAVLAELRALEARVSRWSDLEPLREARGAPPPGFASLQLLSAEGYREAYRGCVTLSMGLRLEGGPLDLSLKDLNLLYEYWCYIALLRLVREVTGAAINPQTLFAVRERGLSVHLKKGKESNVCFELGEQRRLTVRYNPTMRQGALVPQCPDMLLTLEHPDWPAAHLVLDAKYRIDKSPGYIAAYGTVGPPEDALNAMHRYRDAILEEVDGAARRSVVQAAALFPSHPDSRAYAEGRLWSALSRVGVGAIPLLPDEVEFLRLWLRRWMDHGGWHLADHAIDHVALHQASKWRLAAAEAVLVGALRGQDPAQHLAWVRETRRYYTPHAKGQPRLLAARAVALYEPARLDKDGGRGAVRYVAEVKAVRIVSRSEIETPWAARRPDEEQVLYELGTLTRLPRPITNTDESGRGDRMGVRRWSSRLALERARTMGELLLESEPEWRLYEELRAAGVKFRIVARRPTQRTEDELQARVEFVLTDRTAVAWRGSAGFVIRDPQGREVSASSPSSVIAELQI